MTQIAQKRKSTLVRQRQIIDAARRLIVKYGSEHVTARRIAKEIGISEGAIYRHFKSKRDILSLLVDDIEKNLIEDITRASSGGGMALETFDTILRSHMSAVEQRRGVSFQVIAEIVSLGDKKLNRRVSDVIDKYLGCIKNLVSEGIKAGQIRADVDLDAVATLFFSMMQGLVTVWALDNYSFKLEDRYLPMWRIFREVLGVVQHRCQAAGTGFTKVSLSG